MHTAVPLLDVPLRAGMIRPRRSWRAAVCLAMLAGLSLSGCAHPLASVIASAPNRIQPWSDESSPLPPVEKLAGVDQHFWVAAGPPQAAISVSVVEPKPQPAGPRGTVLVLHGLYARSFWMLRFANGLAAAGYRAVLADLRGHGSSSGQWLTYGVQEARDLSQVIDALEARGLSQGPVGVMGVSYGATTSIHLAAADPRVAAVVAVAPFSTMRDAVPHYVRTMLPGAAAVSDRTFEQAIDEAGAVGQFDPDVASAVLAVQRTRAPVLILHGTDDWLVPVWHSVRLRDAAPDHVRLVLLPGFGHVAIWADPRGEVAERARTWFDRHLASLPAAPATR